MVAGAFNTNILNFWCTPIFNERFCIGSIHLYFILMNREKALETVIVLALVSLLAFFKFHLNWLIYVAIGLLVISFISKKLTIIIGKAWFSFSHYFGMVMNTIIMCIIFYFVLTPLSFFQRLTGKNQILRKEKGDSYFYKRNHLYSNKDIEKPW